MAAGPRLLKRFLKNGSHTLESFAALVGTSKSLVHDWQSDCGAKPGLATAFRIEDATAGAIPARSWLERSDHWRPRQKRNHAARCA